jgi:hypothetical protein
MILNNLFLLHWHFYVVPNESHNRLSLVPLQGLETTLAIMHQEQDLMLPRVQVLLMPGASVEEPTTLEPLVGQEQAQDTVGDMVEPRGTIWVTLGSLEYPVLLEQDKVGWLVEHLGTKLQQWQIKPLLVSIQGEHLLELSHLQLLEHSIHRPIIMDRM